MRDHHSEIEDKILKLQEAQAIAAKDAELRKLSAQAMEHEIISLRRRQRDGRERELQMMVQNLAAQDIVEQHESVALCLQGIAVITYPSKLLG
jgi:hypothetical protein